MSVLFTDNFTRADNADLGANWDVQTGCQTWKIVSNTAQPSVLTGANVVENVNSVSAPDNQYAQVTIGTAGTTAIDAGWGATVRASSSAQTMYFAISSTTADGSGNFNELYKAVAGVYTSLQKTATSGALATTQTVYVKAVGTAIDGKRSGVATLTASDAAIASGRFGIILSTDAGSNGSFTAFEGGDFGGSFTISTNYSSDPVLQMLDWAGIY